MSLRIIISVDGFHTTKMEENKKHSGKEVEEWDENREKNTHNN